MKARDRAYHVPFHADPRPRGPIRLAPACFPMAPRRRALTCQESNLPFTFWFKPASSFGLFVFTGIQTAIHLRCAYGTCLAFTPHRGLQCRSLRRRDESSFEKCVVPGASNMTVASHACPGGQLLVAQQVTAPESRDCRIQGVTRHGRALPSNTSTGLRPADGDTCRKAWNTIARSTWDWMSTKTPLRSLMRLAAQRSN